MLYCQPKGKFPAKNIETVGYQYNNQNNLAESSRGFSIGKACKYQKTKESGIGPA
jgi:hypothetical protein